jgi:hypothetical protein
MASRPVVTTRVLRGLTPGRSTVAFYGNQELDNRYLGRSTFVEYVPLDTERGREIARESPLYRQRGMPGSARGFVLVKDFRLAGQGEDLSSLDGKIEASGRTLAREALPQGPQGLGSTTNHEGQSVLLAPPNKRMQPTGRRGAERRAGGALRWRR